MLYIYIHLCWLKISSALAIFSSVLVENIICVGYIFIYVALNVICVGYIFISGGYIIIFVGENIIFVG